MPCGRDCLSPYFITHALLRAESAELLRPGAGYQAPHSSALSWMVVPGSCTPSPSAAAPRDPHDVLGTLPKGLGTLSPDHSIERGHNPA